jgi:hypothetical protein
METQVGVDAGPQVQRSTEPGHRTREGSTIVEAMILA